MDHFHHRKVVNVEIARRKTDWNDTQIVQLAKNFLLHQINHQIDHNTVIDIGPNHPREIQEQIRSISVCDHFTPNEKVEIYAKIYQLLDYEVADLDFEFNGDDVKAANHWQLPNSDMHGLWESLIYEDGIKENILKFVRTTMLFAMKQVNSNVIACNRLVLLHGPPGTGKTSLCRAIAQKLAIELKPDQYKFVHLFEINSHSLFSKWFSESGKLVQKLFTEINNLILVKSALVIVLIDEVESIAYARNAISSNEPSDSIRVVNAVLTQLDRIRTASNVLVLSTSNLTNSIDRAFLDRADIVQYIGNPSVKAIYEIYGSALQELGRCGVIVDYERFPHFNKIESESSNSFADMFFKSDDADEYDEEVMPDSSKISNKPNNGAKLFELASLSTGLSGRALRKIPFLAHANYLYKDSVNMVDYMEAMKQAIIKVFGDKRALNAKNTPLIGGAKSVMFTQKSEAPDQSKNISDINYQIFTEEINEDLEKLNLLAEEL